MNEFADVETGAHRADVLAVLVFGVDVFANHFATQWPKRHADARTGKRTLPTRRSPIHLRRTH